MVVFKYDSTILWHPFHQELGSMSFLGSKPNLAIGLTNRAWKDWHYLIFKARLDKACSFCLVLWDLRSGIQTWGRITNCEKARWRDIHRGTISPQSQLSSKLTISTNLPAMWVSNLRAEVISPSQVSPDDATWSWRPAFPTKPCPNSGLVT